MEFRHSSATYYASKLNRQQLCIRYGWAISSRMPDTYFTRSGVDMEELDKKFTGTEVEVLKGLLARMEQETQLKAERILHLEQDIATLQQNLASVAAILKLNPHGGKLKPISEEEREAGAMRLLQSPRADAHRAPGHLPSTRPASSMSGCSKALA